VGHFAEHSFGAAEDVRTVAGRDDAYPLWSMFLIALRRLPDAIGRFK
jgi:hypothetical protein